MRLKTALLCRTIGWRTVLGPLVGAAALVAVAAQGWTSQEGVRQQLDRQSAALLAQAELQSAQNLFQVARGALTRAIGWHALEIGDEQVGLAKAQVERWIKAAGSSGPLRATPELATALDSYVGGLKDTLDLFDSPSVAAMMTVDSEQKADALLGLINHQEDALAAKARTAQEAAMEAQASAARINAMIALAASFAALAVGLAAARSIARPVRAMTDAMTRLANGEQIGELDGGKLEEVCAMAAATAVFAEKAKRAAALEQAQTQAHLGRAEEDERVRRAAEQQAAAAAAAIVVDSIGAGLARLADGDLTFRLEAELPGTYEKLRVDLNHVMDHLQGVMRGIVTNTDALRSGTGEISNAADDLSRRTEQQAASLEETAAALDEITATVRKTSEGAKHAQGVVSKTREDAQVSGMVMQQAVAAMDSIKQSSDQITQIIGVIDEIAFQTNLLALNAGVEAARAGDAGRGFAVVASEVRALAQRSAEAAKEIKALISVSARQVGSGVKLVGDTGEALGRIVSQVNEITTIVSEIAASAQEQATGLDQVNTAINQMDQVTQQNAAMVEQSTAASHALSQETEELASLTAMFQTGETAGAIPQGEASASKRSARPAANKAISLKRAKTAITLKVVSQAKPRPAFVTVPAAQVKGWEEF